MNLKVLGIIGGIGATGAGVVYWAIVHSRQKSGMMISKLIKSESFVNPLTRNSKNDAKWNEMKWNEA